MTRTISHASHVWEVLEIKGDKSLMKYAIAALFFLCTPAFADSLDKKVDERLKEREEIRALLKKEAQDRRELEWLAHQDDLDRAVQSLMRKLPEAKDQEETEE